MSHRIVAVRCGGFFEKQEKVKNNIPRGGFRQYEFIDIITIEDAPAWLAPNRGVANPHLITKAGTIIIQCPAEKGKEK